MIKTYSENKKGRTKVFFKVREDIVSSVIVGNQAVSTEQGYQFYVKDYVADQIDKCELYMDGLTPKLRLKEGESLDVPTEEEEKEKEIQELENKLKQLKGDDADETI